jgi:hypothetical protein
LTSIPSAANDVKDGDVRRVRAPYIEIGLEPKSGRRKSKDPEKS